ncbi:hypothetical protein ACHHYP_05535, partial [Achlya hypogyna]
MKIASVIAIAALGVAAVSAEHQAQNGVVHFDSEETVLEEGFEPFSETESYDIYPTPPPSTPTPAPTFPTPCPTTATPKPTTKAPTTAPCTTTPKPTTKAPTTAPCTTTPKPTTKAPTTA